MMNDESEMETGREGFLEVVLDKGQIVQFSSSYDYL